LLKFGLAAAAGCKMVSKLFTVAIIQFAMGE
jgi:hypothetical protein